MNLFIGNKIEINSSENRLDLCGQYKFQRATGLYLEVARWRRAIACHAPLIIDLIDVLGSLLQLATHHLAPYYATNTV